MCANEIYMMRMFGMCCLLLRTVADIMNIALQILKSHITLYGDVY